MSAAPTITRQNASIRAADLERSRPDRVAKDEDAADDRGEIGRDRGEGDDLDARADLQPASRGVEGHHRGDQSRRGPRADQLEHPARDVVDQELDRDVGDAEECAGGGA